MDYLELSVKEVEAELRALKCPKCGQCHSVSISIERVNNTRVPFGYIVRKRYSDDACIEYQREADNLLMAMMKQRGF